LNHRKKTKADGSRLIPRKHTETLVLLSVFVFEVAEFLLYEKMLSTHFLFLQRSGRSTPVATGAFRASAPPNYFCVPLTLLCPKKLFQTYTV